MFNKGKALLAKGKHKNASEHFEIAILKRPSNYLYHYYYGLALQELYQTDRAVTAYKKTISLNPNYAPPYKKLGLLYLQFGENLKARITLKKYMSLAPTASDIEPVKTLVDEIQ
jgi:tetratricopeptide (TPR) repeat protein